MRIWERMGRLFGEGRRKSRAVDGWLWRGLSGRHALAGKFWWVKWVERKWLEGEIVEKAGQLGRRRNVKVENARGNARGV